MAGIDEDNRPEPHAESQTEPQKDAPLPSFIYGRNGHGDDFSAGRDGARHRQTQYGRIAEMDRKTLLGLATGAGMLGLVLFFVGMLVGAGLFMDPDEKMLTDANTTAQPEILATLPDEPVSDKTAPMPIKPDPSNGMTGGAGSAAPKEPVTNDPVGDLIAERSAGLANQDADDALNNAAETDAPAAPDDNGAPTAPAAPDLPAAAPLSDAEKAAAKAKQVAAEPRQIKAPEIKSSETASAAPSVPDVSDAPAAETATATAKAAPEPKPAAKPASSGSTSGASTPFSVQVGAFKVHENASQRAEELRKLGLEVSVVARGPEGDAVWYYVRVGKYATMKEARDSATAVKKDHKLDGFPVRAEPNDREVS